jgi:hypothetical protein
MQVALLDSILCMGIGETFLRSNADGESLTLSRPQYNVLCPAPLRDFFLRTGSFYRVALGRSRRNRWTMAACAPPSLEAALFRRAQRANETPGAGSSVEFFDCCEFYDFVA